MDECDDFRSLRNFYYLGHFADVQTEACSLKEANPDQAGAIDVYYHLAGLELQPEEVFRTVTEKDSTALQAVKLLGTYKSATEDNKDLVFETLEEWLADDMIAADETLQLVAAMIYLAEGRHKDALRLVATPGENLEKMALMVQVYLQINRVDLAARTAQQMADVDDDDPLTQLCQAWTYIAQGDSKVSEAAEVLQELVDKFGPSVSILTSQGVCQVHLHNWTEAMALFKQARSLAKVLGQKTDVDTLANAAVVQVHLCKDPSKYISEMETLHPDTPFLKKQQEMDALFEQHAATYSCG